MSKRHTSVFFNLILSVSLICGLSACDSGSGDGGGDSSLAISGKVTDNAGFAKTMADIEGAAVIASELQSSGSLRAMDGETTTDASGRFTLDVAATANTIVLRATKADFESKVIVEPSNGSESVSAMPMNSETHAEANVLVEARAGSGTTVASSADVALFVDANVAAAINAGTATAAEVAAVINSGKSAERAHAEDDPEGFDDDESRRRVDENRRQSFLNMQSQLSAATSASAQSSARKTFERAYVDAYATAGVKAEAQARASHSRKSAMIEAAADASLSADARFALRKRAEASVALATSAAIEALLKANGAAQAQIDAVATAGEMLYAEIEDANTEAEVSAAFGTFAASVEVELAAAINVSGTVVATARAATDAAKVALQTAIETSITASEIADAYVSFFAAAEASAAAALSASTNASMGGEILALIALH